MAPTSPKRPGRPIPRPLIYAAAALGLVLVTFVACQLRPKAPVAPFRTAEVERGDVVHAVSASGVLQALVTVQVGSQVSGQIKEVLVDFNSQVVKGQPLAVIDPGTYASRVRQAEADLSASQATLSQTEATLRQAEAQSVVDLATYNRTKMLFEKGIDSPSAMDTAQATYRRSLAAVDSARAAVNVQRARITQSRAALQTGQVDLGRTRILSPITGVVVNRAIDPGQTVQASFQAPVLFQIAQDLSKLQVKILVDEADIGQVREGQTVRFTVDAFPDESFTGAVTQVRKQPETQSNVVAYQVIAQADNPRGALLPGMTANAEIQIDRRSNVLKVPVAALRFKPADQREAASAGPGSPQALAAELRTASNPQARERLYDQLGLSADQKVKARAIAEQTRGKIMSAIGNGAAMRQLVQDGRARFEALLTPQQKTMLDALTGRSSGQRRAAQAGVVYVLSDGKPRPVFVRIGASDGTSTEVSGALKVGDDVIVGGGPQPKVRLGGPPGMGGGNKR